MTETTWMQRGAAGAAIEGLWLTPKRSYKGGLLHILWMNRQAHNATPLYHVGLPPTKEVAQE